MWQASPCGLWWISGRGINRPASCYSFRVGILSSYICSGNLLESNLMEPRLILINLLVKLGVAAAVSSSLVRSKEFKRLLFREERTFRQIGRASCRERV